jgi:ribosomal protein L31
MKKGIHWEYHDNVEVNCICWAKFAISTTIPWPIKVEICQQCHPAFNKDKVIKKVVKWRMEKFLEKQKKIDAIKK